MFYCVAMLILSVAVTGFWRGGQGGKQDLGLFGLISTESEGAWVLSLNPR